jgi:hypothetical protein
MSQAAAPRRLTFLENQCNDKVVSCCDIGMYLSVKEGTECSDLHFCRKQQNSCPDYCPCQPACPFHTGQAHPGLRLSALFQISKSFIILISNSLHHACCKQFCNQQHFRLKASTTPDHPSRHQSFLCRTCLRGYYVYVRHIGTARDVRPV